MASSYQNSRFREHIEHWYNNTSYYACFKFNAYDQALKKSSYYDESNKKYEG